MSRQTCQRAVTRSATARYSCAPCPAALKPRFARPRRGSARGGGRVRLVRGEGRGVSD